MEIRNRVITQLPLKELWRDNGFSAFSRGRQLTSDDIVAMLRVSPVQFVVADVGAKPRWIELSACFDFWKQEVKPHFCDAGAAAILERYPGDYCYFGSEWGTSGGTSPIVVLEKRH